jgi:putative ABC transport system permease protein
MTAGVPVTAARWMLLGEWRAHPARVVTAALAIAIGVALGFAVHLVNASALDSFERALSSVNGAADMQVRAATPAGFAEALYPRLARLPGVAGISPVVELPARAAHIAPDIAGAGRGRVTLIGLDPLRAIAVTPSLVGRPGGEAGVLLSRAALDALDRRIGRRITLVAAGRSHAFTIAGVLPGASTDQAIAVIDIATAQWHFGQLGRLQRLDIRLGSDADPVAVRRAITTLLPADAILATPEADARRTDSLSRAYRVNLEMLAMVALLTGGFLVYSAQSLSVARRGPQFALLRVLGLPRRALLAQVLAEGAALGLAGSLLGIALGQALADVAVSRLGGDLGGGYFGAGTPHLGFAPGPAAVFAGIGIIVAMVSSLLPAREAAAAAPAVALKTSGALGDPRRAARLWPGAVLLALGGLAALAPPIAGLPLLGYAAMALLLAGGVATMPALVRLLLAPLRRLTGLPPALDLALKRLWGAPQQAAVALCGIVASTSLMVAMAVMVASFRGSVDDWLVAILPSDIYLHLEGAEGGGIDPAGQARLAATPGIASIAFVRQIPLRLAADRPPVLLSAQPIDPAAPGRRLLLVSTPLPVPAGETPVWVSEAMLWLYDARPGTRLMLPIGGRLQPVFVAGVWRDYARQFGAIAMADSDYVRLSGDAGKSEAAIDARPGTNIDRLIPALRRALPPGLAEQALFGQPRQMRAMALTIFDRSFAITYALEAIAIIIGLVGVAATFSAQTLARTREFGMLRHIGVSRRQIGAMLGAEGALLGLVGGLAGLALGVVMSLVLIHVVNPQSFHWTMDTRLPWGLFGTLLTALVVAAAGTALLAGRRALSGDAVRAVREDW